MRKTGFKNAFRYLKATWKLLFLNLQKIVRLIERSSLWCIDILSMQASMYGPVSEFVSQSDYDLILVSQERIEGKLWQVTMRQCLLPITTPCNWPC